MRILQAHLLEQIVQCLLIKGEVTGAAEKVLMYVC